MNIVKSGSFGSLKDTEAKKMNDKQNAIIKEYSTYLELKGFEKETTYRYILSLKRYFSFLELNNAEYGTVCVKQAGDYRAYMVNAGNLSRSSVNNELNRVKSFYSFLLKRGYIFKNPFKGVSNLKQVIHLVKNILSIEDIGKLLDNFSVKSDYDLMFKSIAELMYGSALRISEAVTLKLDDVDYEAKTLNIVQRKTKGEKRKIITNDIALNVLKQYLNHSRERLVKDKDIEYIYPQVEIESYVVSLNRKLKNECERLGLKVITSHGLRHSAGTHLMKKGAGIRLIQGFLGHKKITSTQVYTHVLKDDLKSVIEKFHPRSNHGGNP